MYLSGNIIRTLAKEYPKMTIQEVYNNIKNG